MPGSGKGLFRAGCLQKHNDFSIPVERALRRAFVERAQEGRLHRMASRALPNLG